MTPLYLGVDPGYQGAIVALDGSGRLAEQWEMPVLGTARRPVDYDTERITAILGSDAALVTIEDPARVVRVAGRMIPSTVLREGVALMRGICAGLGVPVRLVAPQTWQAGMARALGGGPKARSVALARVRWPDLDLRPGRRRVDHDGLADAAHVADWGRVEALLEVARR